MCKILNEYNRKLKDLREAQRLNQPEAAQRIGICRTYLVMIESGTRHPSVKVAQNIEKVFGMDWTGWFEPKNDDTD